MEQENEKVKFIDAESFTGKGDEKITFREIVLSHVKKISQLASVEFRGGYWEHRPNPNPQISTTVDVYVPDSREIYSNAVEYLFDILYPHFDKEMLKSGEMAEEVMEEAYDDNTIIKEEDREDKNSKEGEEADRKFGSMNNRMSYRKKRRIINRELFREICCFLKRKDYLQGQIFEEKI